MLFLLFLAFTAVHGIPTIDDAEIKAAIGPVASYFNISFVASITMLAHENQTLVTTSASAGFNDRIGGTEMSKDSRIPGGSCTKPFTVAAVMGLVESGILDLDRPVHEYVDPWLAAQSKKTLFEFVER